MQGGITNPKWGDTSFWKTSDEKAQLFHGFFSDTPPQLKFLSNNYSKPMYRG